MLTPHFHRGWPFACAVVIGAGSLSSVSHAQQPARDPSLDSKAVAAIEKGLSFLEKAQKPEGFWSSQDHPGLTGLVVQAEMNGGEGFSSAG